jgi:restriction system protein
VRRTSVLFTTRQVPTFLKENVTVISLDPLSDNEIRELLRQSRFEHIASDRVVQTITGNPRSALLATDAISRNLIPDDPDALASLFAPFHAAGIVGLNGQPIQEGGAEQKRLVTRVSEVNEELIRSLGETPEELYQLPPRKFELLVAELLNRQGFDVEVTPATRDGGKDIYAAKRDDFGEFLYLVECKRWAPHKRVGIEVVQRLHGVVSAKRATAGMVATTSFFSGPAEEFQREVRYQLSLKDYFGIQRWLKNTRPDV